MESIEAKASETRHPRKVFITGGSSGIGASLVQRLVHEKNHVVFIDKNPPDKIAENSFYLYQDLSLLGVHEATTLLEQTIDVMGVPDTLIFNAGRGIHELLKDGNPETWEYIFKVNVLSQMTLLRAFLPFMLQKAEGDIIFISSIAATHPYPGGGIYAATKAALSTLAESLRLEVQPQIRVTTLFAGVVDTPFFSQIIGGTQTPFSMGWGSLKANEIASCLIFILNQPHHVCLNQLVMRPVGQSL